MANVTTKLNITPSVTSPLSCDTSPTPHSSGSRDEHVPDPVVPQAKRGLEAKRPPALSLTPIAPTDTEMATQVAQAMPQSSDQDNISSVAVEMELKKVAQSRKPPPLSLGQTNAPLADTSQVAQSSNQEAVDMEPKKVAQSRKPPPLSLAQTNAPLDDTSQVAQSSNQDNFSSVAVEMEPKRVLSSKRPPPLTLTPVTPSNTGVATKVAQNNVTLSDTYRVSQSVTSFPDTSQKASQIRTPLSASSLPAPSPQSFSPKFSPNSKSELPPSKVSPSHPYYSATRQYSTSKFTLSDSTHMPPATSSSGHGKKNFKPTLNLGGSSNTDLAFRSKRPPSIHALPKRRSTIYTREQLQELVQLRASEAKMENISDEHKAAIQKFLDDKASVLKCGELSITDLEKQKELGFGNSGNVSKKRHLLSGVIMACKTIKLEIKEAQRNAILSELHVLHDCSSPYIVGFFGSFCYSMDLEICMEYMDGGSLDQVIRHWGRIEEDVIAVITRAVLFGMFYLFSELSILHRDVKPSNILLNSLGEVKLCDFGVSKKLLDTKGVANTFVGTRSYMAPERLIGSDYTLKSDLWSLGISLIEMSIGKYPIPPLTDHQIDVSMSLPPAGSENQTPLPPDQFDHPLMAPFEMLQYVAMEEPPTMPIKYFSLDLCEFVEFCLMREPDQRASVQELMCNSFITSQPKVNMSAWAIKVAQHGID